MSPIQIVAAVFLVGVLVWGIYQPGPTHDVALDIQAMNEQYRTEARAELDALNELEQRINAEFRQEYLDANPDLDSAIRDLILVGELTLGMTSEQVIASWGMPGHIETMEGPWGRHQQWEYRDGHRVRYVYFENGVVASWQY